MMPKQPLVIIIQGLDEEELKIKSKIIKDMCVERGMDIADPYELGFGALVVKDNFKGSFGVAGNNQCSYKGAFQFCGFMCKMEEIPRIWKEWKEISERYWAMKHERPKEEVMMSGFNTQGPLPFGRIGVFEVDWWWDHGDPEEIKRATQIVRKFNEYALKNKGPLFRNNMGAGELVLPYWGVYYDLLKKTKDLLDPKNIMNPDVLPIGSDYLEVI
jgi:FAD/FMN-containing dehydrogenase